MFKEMICIAKNKLAIINEMVEGLPVPQVTVLLSTNKNIFVAVNDINGTICEELKFNKDTKISEMLTMWKDGGIDLPSMNFRKVLVEMDEDNNNVNILLQGKENYLIKRLSETIID